jgi:predicted metal-dependent hydrolase
MSKTIAIGSPPIHVHLRHSARARRYSLKVSNSDGLVHLILPNHGSERQALQFAQTQEVWLRAALDRLPDLSRPEFGGYISFEGRDVLLQAGQSRHITLQDGVLHVPGSSEQLASKLRGFLKVAARERLSVASHFYADQLGRKVARITLRDTSTRWGSCTESGNLMYSWRLIMAPVAVLNYVAAHEVAHLVEMNHSPAFWRVVAGLMPDFEIHRRWLKQNGAELHRVRF